MNERLKDVLDLHSGERRALRLLLPFLFLAACWVAWEQWLAPTPKVDLRPYERELALLDSLQAARMAERSDRSRSVVPDSLFVFDPNHLPVPDWMALGLSQKQAEAIHRYEAAGGRFRAKPDLARMRVVDPDLFAAWEPYIALPDERPTRTRSTRKVERPAGPEVEETNAPFSPREMAPSRQHVDVNTADSAALVALRGIGPSFARGIVRYRELLGGYHDLDQLAEVYVLRDKPDAIARIRELLFVDTLHVKRIPLNTCTVEELAAHVYVNWDLARTIVAYRDQHGPFRQREDLLGCHRVDSTLFRKLAPYLQVP